MDTHRSLTAVEKCRGKIGIQGNLSAASVMAPLAGKCTAHRVRRWDPSRDSAEVARIYKEVRLVTAAREKPRSLLSEGLTSFGTGIDSRKASEYAAAAVQQLARQHSRKHSASQAARQLRPLEQGPPAPAPPAPALRAAWPRPGWLLPRLGWGLYPTSSSAGLGGSQAGSTAPLNGGGASQATLASCSPYSDEAGGAGSQQHPSPAPRLHEEQQPGALRSSEVSQAGLKGWSGWRVGGAESWHPAPGSGQVTPAHTSKSLQQAGKEGGRQLGCEPQSPAAPTSNSPGGSLGGLSLPAAAARPAGAPAAAHPAGPVAPLPPPPEARPQCGPDEQGHVPAAAGEGGSSCAAESCREARQVALWLPRREGGTRSDPWTLAGQESGGGLRWSAKLAKGDTWRVRPCRCSPAAVRWQRTSIWLEVAEGNTPALNLYRQEGYVPVRQLGWPWRSGVQVCMRKVLRRQVQPVSSSHLSDKRAAAPSLGNCNRNTVATQTASRVFVWDSAKDD
ncbi:hypothetical protein HaLaN_11548 [Haematococcus lacustris]|uniref:Uncharacterized protein n=1 Tax=Haematococcus lacustris TaxID=44745 RepID=A0A699Z0M6_HAELA|nr:hypothetical protein HaLaN_11548 [Haematococcus lacustris]